MYRGCRLGDEQEGKSRGMDGCLGVLLVVEKNDAGVVCVLSLHLLAADTMMRQIVREKR